MFLNRDYTNQKAEALEDCSGSPEVNSVRTADVQHFPEVGHLCKYFHSRELTVGTQSQNVG